MECPKCKMQMEKGWLGGGYWVKGTLKKLPWLIRPTRFSFPKLERKFAIAWRCPKCEYLELRTEE